MRLLLDGGARASRRPRTLQVEVVNHRGAFAPGQAEMTGEMGREPLGDLQLAGREGVGRRQPQHQGLEQLLYRQHRAGDGRIELYRRVQNAPFFAKSVDHREPVPQPGLRRLVAHERPLELLRVGPESTGHHERQQGAGLLRAPGLGGDLLKRRPIGLRQGRPAGAQHVAQPMLLERANAHDGEEASGDPPLVGLGGLIQEQVALDPLVDRKPLGSRQRLGPVGHVLQRVHRIAQAELRQEAPGLLQVGHRVVGLAR
ncbi:MAG: hypothetical protein DI596_06785 [Azospira oryzae]|nr:MAG: hypothetical protein DI596_06785 [Azospira oryzae]PZP80254.1 MAG: hypothetical protein DI593_06785 [Azospira oryzae]